MRDIEEREVKGAKHGGRWKSRHGGLQRLCIKWFQTVVGRVDDFGSRVLKKK